MKSLTLEALSSERVAVVERILKAALSAVDPYQAVKAALHWDGKFLQVGGQSYDLENYHRLVVVGAGKAAPLMGLGLYDFLGDRIKDGILICKHQPAMDETRLTKTIQCLLGNHPIPGENSLESTRQLVGLLRKCDERTLVFCLISGGGSALMTLPFEGVSLNDMQMLTRLLLACGADIAEINTIRKHLDRVKGGGLAKLAIPARVVSLIISDVVGNPLEVIASGPTVPDPSTYEDAMAILEKYKLVEKTPETILEIFHKGLKKYLPETLKPGDICFDKVQNLIVADNRMAAEAALKQAQQDGFAPHLLTNSLTGEACQAGQWLSETLREMTVKSVTSQTPVCWVAGGETTVTLNGRGLGGRNQEVALAAVEPLAGLENIALITLATDGEDGPTDAAGAVVTGESWSRARSLGISPGDMLANHDSYHFFKSLNDLIVTGSTGTNVNDLNFVFTF